jgi:hypothetical protein
MSSKLLVAMMAVAWLVPIPALAHDSERAHVVGDEMSDAMPTSSIAKNAGGSCDAERPASMSTARGFDILSAIGPKTGSASEATP